MASDAVNDSDHLSGTRPKSFQRTCSLLSRYLKEKGSFKELTLALNQNSDYKGEDRFETIDFFRMVERSAPVEPSAVGGAAGDCGEIPCPYTVPMTIFYAGQVVVINDLPTCIAREILQLAARSDAAVVPESAADFFHTLLPLDGLPMARRRSIAQFLKKRKERITCNAHMYSDQSSGVTGRDGTFSGYYR